MMIQEHAILRSKYIRRWPAMPEPCRGVLVFEPWNLGPLKLEMADKAFYSTFLDIETFRCSEIHTSESSCDSSEQVRVKRQKTDSSEVVRPLHKISGDDCHQSCGLPTKSIVINGIVQQSDVSGIDETAHSCRSKKGEG